MDNSVNQPLMMSHISMHTPGDDGEIDVDETYVGVDKDARLAYAGTSALPPPKPPRTKSKGQLAGLQARRPQQPLVCRVIWGGFASGMVSVRRFASRCCNARCVGVAARFAPSLLAFSCFIPTGARSRAERRQSPARRLFRVFRRTCAPPRNHPFRPDMFARGDASVALRRRRRRPGVHRAPQASN